LFVYTAGLAVDATSLYWPAMDANNHGAIVRLAK
jgi:hypothetical protein